MIEVRDAGAGVIDGELDVGPEPDHRGAEGPVRVDRVVLGDLDDGMPARRPEHPCQGAATLGQERRRHVETEPCAQGQLERVAERDFHGRQLELETHPASDGGREGDVRRTAVIESGERLEPDDPPAGELDDRLEDRAERRGVDGAGDPTTTGRALPAGKEGRGQDSLGDRGELADRRQILDHPPGLFIVGGHDADQGDELAVDLDGRHPPALDPERRHGIAVGARFGGRGPAVGPRAGARASEQAPGDAWRKGVAGTHRESRQADDREGEHALIRALE